MIPSAALTIALNLCQYHNPAITFESKQNCVAHFKQCSYDNIDNVKQLKQCIKEAQFLLEDINGNEPK